jgi:hypothetical protein
MISGSNCFPERAPISIFVHLEKRELRIGDPQIESFFDLDRLEFLRELELDLRVAIPQRTEESYLA